MKQNSILQYGLNGTQKTYQKATTSEQKQKPPDTSKQDQVSKTTIKTPVNTVTPPQANLDNRLSTIHNSATSSSTQPPTPLPPPEVNRIIQGDDTYTTPINKAKQLTSTAETTPTKPRNTSVTFDEGDIKTASLNAIKTNRLPSYKSLKQSASTTKGQPRKKTDKVVTKQQDEILEDTDDDASLDRLTATTPSPKEVIQNHNKQQNQQHNKKEKITKIHTSKTHKDYDNKNFARVNIWLTILAPLPDDKSTYLQDFLKEYVTSIFKASNNKIAIAAWDDPAKELPMWKRPKHIHQTGENQKDAAHNATYIQGWGPWVEHSKNLNLRMRLAWPKSEGHITERSVCAYVKEYNNQPSDYCEKIGGPNYPLPVDAPSSVCIGWLLYTNKSIHSEEYKASLVHALARIGFKVQMNKIGVRWRTIAGPSGKRPPYNQDDIPGSAIHLYADYQIAHYIVHPISELLSKPASRRAPMGIATKLIPAHESHYFNPPLSAKERASIDIAYQHQKYFHNHHIQTFPMYTAVALDDPLSEKNTITLRRYLAKAPPAKAPGKRLFCSVQRDWQNPAITNVTTTKYLYSQATNFITSLTSRLRSEFPRADDTQPFPTDKWFTLEARNAADSAFWDPKTQEFQSGKARDLEVHINNDVWGLKDDLEHHLAATATEENMEINLDDQTKQTQHDGLQPDSAEINIQNLGIQSDQSQTTADPIQYNDGMSMSTAAKTTTSTRLHLQETKAALQTAETQIKQLQEKCLLLETGKAPTIEIPDDTDVVSEMSDTEPEPPSKSTPLPQQANNTNSNPTGKEILTIQDHQKKPSINKNLEHTPQQSNNSTTDSDEQATFCSSPRRNRKKKRPPEKSDSTTRKRYIQYSDESSGTPSGKGNWSEDDSDDKDLTLTQANRAQTKQILNSETASAANSAIELYSVHNADQPSNDRSTTNHQEAQHTSTGQGNKAGGNG